MRALMLGVFLLGMSAGCVIGIMAIIIADALDTWRAARNEGGS